MFELLAQSFATGAIINALMALLVAEAVLLIALRRHRGLAVASLDAACIVVPGLCLMWAVQLALTDADWRMIGLVLAAGGLVHALDVVRRLRS